MDFVTLVPTRAGGVSSPPSRSTWAAPRSGVGRTGTHARVTYGRTMLKAQPELQGFTDTALPKTMTVARRYRTALNEYLLAPADWAFEDRVFVLVAPTWEIDVRTYYINGGHDLADRCDPHQQSRLDGLCVDKLKRVIAKYGLTPSRTVRH